MANPIKKINIFTYKILMLSDYTFIKTLGRGAEGQVDLVEYNNEKIVVKTFFVKNNEIKTGTLHEVNALTLLQNCPSVNHLINVKIELNLKIKIFMAYHDSDLEVFYKSIDYKERLTHFEQLKKDMFSALYNLYHNGIIHNDVKPPNILVDYMGKEVRFYLADFGLSVQTPCDVNKRNIKNIIVGSPIYKAPELLYGDHRYSTNVDVWSLGITFVEYLQNDTDVITYPIDFIHEDDNDNILSRILNLLDKPIDAIDPHLYKNTDSFINLTMYNFPSEIETLLHQMLQFNKNKRPLIINLYQGEIYPKVDIIDIGETKTVIPIKIYYDNLFQLINLCRAFNLHVYTCYFAINLIERYLHNYKIKDKNALSAYSSAILILTALFHEGTNIEKEVFVGEYQPLFSIENLQLSIALVYQRFHFLLTTCSTDEIFYLLYHNNDYDRLLNVYRKLEAQQVYGGDVFTDEWIALF